ncbi:MAG: hypothetical protein EHM28_07985 [Spirochaetaceae bacterium]|nr:MAG: hypothetical protein EHM28_07985 [Spirochaetaceae bacterium]
MRKIIVIAISVLALAAFVACGNKAQGGGAAAAADAGKDLITLKNATGEDIYEMMISPVSMEDSWEKANILEGNILKNGASTTIPRGVFTKNEKYDLTWTSVGKELDYFQWEVDVKNIGTITVTKEDLDDQQ